MHSGSSSSQPQKSVGCLSCLCFRSASPPTAAKMNSLREMQNELKTRNTRILYLEQELARKNERIRILESELDKYRSVLQPVNATSKARPRQGISAEPASYKTAAQSSKPLERHAKNHRQVVVLCYMD